MLVLLFPMNFALANDAKVFSVETTLLFYNLKGVCGSKDIYKDFFFPC